MTWQNLPLQSTSFIGREEEIETISQLVDDEHCRLLTLSGNGGIGKTRLVLEVAHRILKRFPDSVLFIFCVSLEEIRSCDCY